MRIIGILVMLYGCVAALAADIENSGHTPPTISVAATRDSTRAEREAYVQALEKAWPIADGIARRMKVQITGTESVSMNSQNRPMYIGGPASPTRQY